MVELTECKARGFCLMYILDRIFKNYIRHLSFQTLADLATPSRSDLFSGSSRAMHSEPTRDSKLTLQLPSLGLQLFREGDCLVSPPQQRVCNKSTPSPSVEFSNPIRYPSPRYDDSLLGPREGLQRVGGIAQACNYARGI